MSATQAAGETVALMRELLSTLEPEIVEIYDDSAEHAGHPGASSGGHYQLIIVSRRFAGCSRVARHRMVYTALADLLQSHVHALAITAWTPEEFSAAFTG